MSRTRKGEKIDGWVILDKPEGLGSTPAVGRVRRLFGAQWKEMAIIVTSR